MPRAALVVPLAAAAVLPPGLAMAQQAPSGWTYDVAVYGWLTALSGTSGAGSTRTKVDASFIDTVEQADSILAFSGHVEARRDALAFFFDGMWSRLGVDDVAAGSARADVTSTTALVELGAAYRVLDRGYDSRREGGWSLELLAGGTRGLLSAPFAPELGDALVQLATRPALRRTLVARGLEFAGAQEWSAVFDALFAEYRQVTRSAAALGRSRGHDALAR